MIISEQQWKAIADELVALKADQRFRVRGEIKWRYFGRDNNDPINSVRHLTQEARDEFRRLMFSILTRRRSVKIICCVASVAASYETPYVNTEEQLYNYTYKAVSERFQYFLQDLSREAGNKHHGIIVADHRGRQQDDAFRVHHHRLVDNDGVFTAEYANYVETIFLTPSHLSVGIQFADMVAGAVGRSFNSGDTTFYDQIVPSFRARQDGSIEGFGLVKFPTRNWR